MVGIPADLFDIFVEIRDLEVILKTKKDYLNFNRLLCVALDEAGEPSPQTYDDDDLARIARISSRKCYNSDCHNELKVGASRYPTLLGFMGTLDNCSYECALASRNILRLDCDKKINQFEIEVNKLEKNIADKALPHMWLYDQLKQEQLTKNPFGVIIIKDVLKTYSVPCTICKKIIHNVYSLQYGCYKRRGIFACSQSCRDELDAINKRKRNIRKTKRDAFFQIVGLSDKLQAKMETVDVNSNRGNLQPDALCHQDSS